MESPLLLPFPPPPPPPPAEMLTEDEFEVARILDQLPDLFTECRSQESSLPVYLHWGSRRRRSDGQNRSSSPARGASTVAPPHQKSAARSPTSPLTFYPSAGEEATAATRKPASRPFKNAKGHKEWVKEQSQTIATLSAHKVNLERALIEAKRRQEALRARNSWLTDIKSKLELGMKMELRDQRLQQNNIYINGQDVVSVRPTILQPTQSNPSMGHQRAERTLPAAFMVGATKPEMAAVVPDLNSTVEEEGLELKLGLGLAGLGSMQQQQQEKESIAYKVAMSAQARKRRIELQREKSLSAFSHPHVMYKIPRLR